MFFLPTLVKNTKKQKYLTIFWIIGLTYNLVFTTNLLAIISGFNQIHLIIFIIDLVILAILLPWKISILSIIVGTFSSMQLYIYLYQDINFSQSKVQNNILISTIRSHFNSFPQTQARRTRSNCLCKPTQKVTKQQNFMHLGM